jgi:ubiquinone/menaquinone biosynthesis C-methylase UbiE
MQPAAPNGRQSALYWDKYRDLIRKMFAPVTEALIADASVTPGASVLDVGTGAGEPALSVAKFVGATGKVCGVDPAPEMIAAAQREASRQSLANIEFQVASGDRLSFPPNTFDAAISRFAAMFFESPVEAVRNIFSTLKPRGRAAFAVWPVEERNPFSYVISQVVERYIGPPPTGVAEMFRFAPPGKLLAVLEEAGARETSERLLQFRIEAAVSAEDFWHLRSEMSERLRSKVLTLPPATLEEIRSQVLKKFRDYSTSSGLSFPAEVLIVSGRLL